MNLIGFYAGGILMSAVLNHLAAQGDGRVRRLARAITEGQPAVPDVATAVRYHQLLETIQQASDTGIRQDTIG
jgi:hypothetical protein